MARQIELKSQFRSPIDRKRTVQYLNSLEALVLFDGYQLVPEISQVREEGPVRTINNRRGRERVERMLIQTEEQLLIEIYPAFPEKLLYRSITERFDFTASGEGCLVERTMSLSLRPGLRPLAAWGAHMLKVAIDRNNLLLTRALAELPEEETWY